MSLTSKGAAPQLLTTLRMQNFICLVLLVICATSVNLSRATGESRNPARNVRQTNYGPSTTAAIRITRLEVPTAVHNGSAAYLVCHYELQGETLYSVKWYRNYVEFFRFLPVNAPRAGLPIKLKGAFVDAKLSNSTHVFLYRTDLDSEGTYTCEVSTESPSYATVRAEQQMKVYVLPQDKPYIEGSEMPFDVGDSINLTCVSGASRPVPKMTWFINGDMALPHQIIQYPVLNLANGLQSRKLGLVLQATPELFPKGHLRLRCSATLLLSYQFEATKILTGGTPSNRTSNGNGFYLNEGRSTQRAREAPIISGGKSKYKVGDWIALNCTTSADDVHLKWYINGNDAGPLQTIEYMSLNEGPYSGWVLGLKLYMQKYHFQLPELRLKCLATFHDIIKEYQSHLTIVSRSQQLLQAQSTSGATALFCANGLTCCLTLLIPYLIIVVELITSSRQPAHCLVAATVQRK